MASGGPVQVAWSPWHAAGWLSIITVGQPGGMIGPPTWGTTPVTMGQVCKSPTRAAGGMVESPVRLQFPALGAVVGDVRLFRRLRAGTAAGARVAAAVNHHHHSLD